MQFPVVRDALVETLLWSTDDIYHPVGFKAKSLSGGDSKGGALTLTKTSGAPPGENTTYRTSTAVRDMEIPPPHYQ